MYCVNCGREISNNANMCPQCGEPVVPKSPANASDKEWLPTLLLCFLGGCFGLHSFYVGKIFIGILQIITLGLFGFWSLFDLVMIVTKNYRDSKGLLVVR